MWTALSVILVLLTLTVADDPTAISTEVAKATNTFSWTFFQELLNEQEGNLVCSPVSLSTLLVLLMQGAKGDTLTELTTVLHIDAEKGKEGYGKLIKGYKEAKGSAILELANAAFLNKGYTVKPDFKTTLQQSFSSDIQTVQFSQKQAAADTINSWVASHTHDRIKQLVQPEMFTEDTRFVLTNAIYFKDIWEKSFNSESTTTDPFYTSKTSSKIVEMMHITDNYRTGSLDNLNANWLDIPFKGDEYSLLVILPNEVDGLNDLVNSMTPDDLVNLINDKENFGTLEVILSLPKFKLESTLKLEDLLKKIGLQYIFSDSADLSGVSEEAVKVSKVIQKAEMEVDEEGAVASAATVVHGFGAFAPSILVMRVDHPFLAFIIDNKHRLILFSSRITDVSVKESDKISV